MVTKKSPRPKIKDKLPEKLPPVKEEAKVLTEEDFIKESDVGQPIEENFIKEGHPTPEEVVEAMDKEIDEGTVVEDDTPKGEEFVKEEDLPKELKALEFMPPANEQPFLFGEADQILNALETELAAWKKTRGKLNDAHDKVEDKLLDARDRIMSLTSAIDATRKHAPMKEDPKPPEQIKETADKIVKEVSQVAFGPGFDKVVDQITHPTEIPEDQPESKTTSSSTAPAEEAPTSSDQKEVAKGAAERDEERTGDLAVAFREGTISVPEVLFPGDIVETSWKSGPYKIESIVGPFYAATVGDEEVPCPPHYTLQCSTVDAKRNKDGRLPKDYEYSYINLVVAVGNRFLSVFEASKDEIFLVAKPVATKESSKQEELPSTEKEEDLY